MPGNSRRVTRSRRLSQAISEGDGISLIVPVERPEAARAAESDGAEALLAAAGAIEAVRAATRSPSVLLRGASCGRGGRVHRRRRRRRASTSTRLGRRDRRPRRQTRTSSRRCSSGSIPRSSSSPRGTDDERLEHVLGLLSDVPAGKLAIAELAGRDADGDRRARAGRRATRFSSVRLARRLRCRGAWLALAALLVLAAALRIPGLGYGLPFPLLNPDERSIVPRAWALVARRRARSGLVRLPEPAVPLLAPFQASRGRAVVRRGAAASRPRSGSRASRRPGGSAGSPTARSPASSPARRCRRDGPRRVLAHARSPTCSLTTLVTVSLALRLPGRLEWAGCARRARGLRQVPRRPARGAAPARSGGGSGAGCVAAAGVAALAFVLTSPFVVSTPAPRGTTSSRVQRLARAGWLGFEDDQPTPLAFLDRLWESLGPFLLVALAGLALAGRKRLC